MTSGAFLTLAMCGEIAGAFSRVFPKKDHSGNIAIIADFQFVVLNIW